MSQALCISTATAPFMVRDAIKDTISGSTPVNGRYLRAIDHLELNEQQTFMVDRAICDSVDPADVEVAESTLQLLPYLPLITPDNKIYLYSRGKGGGENRLKANTSVGLGGHVDRPPPVGISLLYWLAQEAAREAEEEAGIVVDPAEINLSHYIIDRSNAVGRVHLGLLAVIEVEDESASSTEVDIIENDGFISLKFLYEDYAMFSKLENWSQMVVKYLYQTRITP